MQEKYMTGLEISEAYFKEYGMRLIKKLSHLESHVAIGLCGGGSECYGFDDDLSRDHDWGPSFCIWVDDDMTAADRFALEKEYAALPREYMGISLTVSSRGGQDRRGVMSVGEFYKRYTGVPGAPQSLDDWLYTPDECFAEAVNGKVFFDGSGKFSAVRETILAARPEDVRIKKISARAAEMAQFGQYNYIRCMRRGEGGAAMLALSGFVWAAVRMIFLLNGAFCPYYKWAIRAMRRLSVLGDMADVLEYLLVGDNTSDEKNKAAVVEDVCALVIREMKAQNLTSSDSDYLEAHAYSAADRIRDTGLRNLHIMTG